MGTDIGLAYPIHVFGVEHLARVARQADQLGLSSLWTGETRGPEIFSSLAIAGEAAPGLALGTGVLAVQLRGPLLTAQCAGTLQAAHPNSDIYLGLGASGRTVVETWHGERYVGRPVAQMREMVEALRLCFTGEPFSFAGEFYTLPKSRMSIALGERRPRIVLGALNERMLRLAGEVADGVLLNTLPAPAIGWAVDRVREGERRAGRPPGSCRIHALIRLGIGDRDQRLDTGRLSLFSYCVVDGYARAFTRAGYGAEVEAVRAAHAAGRRKEAVAAVSDEMVDSIEITGDAERVRGALQAYLDAGVESAVVVPLLEPGRELDGLDDLLEVVVPGSPLTSVR